MSLHFAQRPDAPSVVIESRVLETLDHFRQRRLWQREAGGQLFARFVGRDTVIGDATAPSRLDRRSRFSFVPHRSTEQSQIRARYREGLHFVGDWHSHPEDDPHPSFLDVASMRDCLKYSQHDLKALVLIVVGRVSGPAGIWVGTVSRTHVRRLLPLTQIASKDRDRMVTEPRASGDRTDHHGKAF